MNRTAEGVADGVSEFDHAGLGMVPSRRVAPPRVAGVAAALECKVTSFQQIQDVDGKPLDRYLVIGQVVATYIDDRFIRDGRFDTEGAKPLGRCGYRDYAVVDSMFELLRPTDPGRVRSEEHTSELQSLMRISYAVFCLKKKTIW